MRIAVTCPDDHSVSPGATFAYALGRIEEGVHNAPIGHAPVPFADFVARLLAEARAEFPGAVVRLERMVDNGDGTSSWIDAEEFDPAVHRSTVAGAPKATEIVAANVQTTGDDA